MAAINRVLEDIRRLQPPVNDKGVHLANRIDLHRLASFIDHSLPHRSDVIVVLHSCPICLKSQINVVFFSYSFII